MTMTTGERLVRCLTGQPVDRVPYGIGIGWSPWGETHERWKKESGDPNLNIAATLGFDRDFVVPNLQSGPWPEFKRERIEVTDVYSIYRNERGIVTKQLRGASGMPEFLSYPVKTHEDWDRLKDERYRLGDASRVVEDWVAFRQKIAESGQGVQAGVFPWGVFGTVRDMMGVEETLVCFYDDPDMMWDITERLTSIWLEMWEIVAREVRIDHIHIWEDMSGKQGSLISPAMVEEFMMPCYDRIVDFARRHNVPIVSVDTDGDCHELVPVMMRHGINMFLPFEVQAGNDIREYRRLYPELGIVGGLDKLALALGRKAIDVEVEKARDMVQSGRYVPGFDHAIPPDVSWEDFKYAAARIREVCEENGR